jgi:hypothetical protein
MRAARTIRGADISSETASPGPPTRAHPLHSGRADIIRKAPFIMSLVRLLGFSTLPCGCVIGRYREVETSRDVRYVEEKGRFCTVPLHRRNHTIAREKDTARSPLAAVSPRAS